MVFKCVLLLFVVAVCCAKKDDFEQDPPNYTVTDVAWFDVVMKDGDGPGQDFTGRFEVALFGMSAPMTVMNFFNLVKGYKRGKKVLQYKNSPIHRVVKDFVIQMGDVTKGDGTGGASIYGEKFNDENFVLSHLSAGMVSMANKGRDTNGSQFFITMVKARWMDGKHVVFGKVIKGFNIVQKINEAKTLSESSWPTNSITIINCGMAPLNQRFEMTLDQIESTEDFHF